MVFRNLSLDDARVLISKLRRRSESTFFKGRADSNEKSERCYSCDSRPDCQRVCIGLFCTPEGLPFFYEVFAGDRNNVTNVEGIVSMM